MEFEVLDVSAEAVVNVAEGVHLACSNGRRGLTTEDMAEYIEKSGETARKAAIVAGQLGWLAKENGLWLPMGSGEISRATSDQKPVVFRQQLQKYRPFVVFVTLLSRGGSSMECARKVRVIFGLGASIECIDKAFRRWGSYARILSGTQVLRLVDAEDGLSPDYILRLVDALKSEIRARIFLTEKLGTDMLAYTDDPVLQSFSQALGMHEEHPISAIDEAGKALEDTLRSACHRQGLDGSKANGIGTLANILTDAKVLTDKHKQLLDGLGALRTISAHGRDKRTLERWIIYPDSALEGILLMISAVRSTWAYIARKEQVM